MYKHALKKLKPDEEKPSVSSEEVMTPHKQAVLYYNENNIDEAFNTILLFSINRVVFSTCSNLINQSTHMLDILFFIVSSTRVLFGIEK